MRRREAANHKINKCTTGCLQLELDTSKHRQLNQQGCMTKLDKMQEKLNCHWNTSKSIRPCHFIEKRFRRIQRYVEHDIPSNTTLGRNLVENGHSYIPEIKLSVSFITENIIYG